MTTEHSNGNRAMTTRDEFTGRELTTTTEKAQGVLAARVTAEIQARYLIAMRNPRDVMVARDGLLRECNRPGLAEVAEYARPVGKEKNKETGVFEEKIARGPSIRLVETALRHFRNIAVETMVTDDGAESRTLRVTVTDLEANTTYSGDVFVPRTTEKRFIDEGVAVISSRTNSYGKTTYLVKASDDEMLVKQAALLSKMVRTLGLRIIPGDLIDDALRRCAETLAGEAKRDPAAAIKALADGFGRINIRPDALAEYLGHSIDTATTDEIAELRGVGNAIKDGSVTWRDALAEKVGSRTEDAPKVETKPQTTAIKEQIAKRARRDATPPTRPREPGDDDAEPAQHTGTPLDDTPEWYATDDLMRAHVDAIESLRHLESSCRKHGKHSPALRELYAGKALRLGVMDDSGRPMDLAAVRKEVAAWAKNGPKSAAV